MQIIFDNGGGVTIQTKTFAAHYINPADAARDALLIAEGASTKGWASDDGARISAADLDKWERAGGAIALSTSDILAAKAAGVYASSWNNQRAFFRGLGCTVEPE